MVCDSFKSSSGQTGSKVIGLGWNGFLTRLTIFRHSLVSRSSLSDHQTTSFSGFNFNLIVRLKTDNFRSERWRLDRSNRFYDLSNIRSDVGSELSQPHYRLSLPNSSPALTKQFNSQHHIQPRPVNLVQHTPRQRDSPRPSRRRVDRRGPFSRWLW